MIASAEHAARGLASSYHLVRALSAVAVSAAQTSDRAGARRLLEDAERTARDIADPYWRAEAMTAWSDARPNWPTSTARSGSPVRSRARTAARTSCPRPRH
jgi:hypothetical protein